ncbi:hypothetical protein D3C73_876390 [compost metagenome]
MGSPAAMRDVDYAAHSMTLFTLEGCLMFFVQRNTDGQLMRVEAEAYAESTEMLPADHPDLQAWFANEVMATSHKQLLQIKQLKQLRQSDLEMIRVLDDLIAVLISKGVILVTDLPGPAQTKLMDRFHAREALGGLSNLVEDDEEGFI